MDGMEHGFKMEMRLELRQAYLLLPPDHFAERLHREYLQRPTYQKIIPTLDGPRLRFFHVVPVSKLKEAWRGELFAGSYEERSFISELVPAPFVRYALAYLYHLASGWCHDSHDTTEQPRRLAGGPPHFRAMEIELGLARTELSISAFDKYWEFRRIACRTAFFRRARRLLDASRSRIDQVGDIFERAGVVRNRPWRPGEFCKGF
jgi:hypothetical protein